jgi:hypothetical protein
MYGARGTSPHDWAPYRFGRWVWIRPWGWTWVDDARWGFAPFHYGRWAYLRNNWCWVPGPRHLRPVYAPALVAWLGGSPENRSYSFGRDIGWFPLAPHEVYVPGYRHTPRYIRRVNLSNTVIADDAQITRTYTARNGQANYRHRGDANAVTVAQQEQFEGSRPIRDQRLRVDDRALRERRDSPRPPRITPDPERRLAGQPRRDGPVDRKDVVVANPKERGDFRSVVSSTRTDRQLRQEQTLPDSGRAALRERVTEPAPRRTGPAGDAVRPSPRTYSPPAAAYSPPRPASSRPSEAAERSRASDAREPQSDSRSQPQSGRGSRPSYQQR